MTQLKSFTSAQMLAALEALNHKLKNPLTLIVGGGGAMILAHSMSLVTTDIDGIPAKGMTPAELDPLIKQVAQEQTIAHDWLNPYFSTFTHVLPSDYGSRLVSVATFSWLTVKALSREDLLIMKCVAGRMKDRQHARALIQLGVNMALVENHLEALAKKKIPGAPQALDFLDELR